MFKAAVKVQGEDRYFTGGDGDGVCFGPPEAAKLFDDEAAAHAVAQRLRLAAYAVPVTVIALSDARRNLWGR